MKRNWILPGLILAGLTSVSLMGCDNFAAVKSSTPPQQNEPVQQSTQTQQPPVTQMAKPNPPQVTKTEPKPLSGNEIARVGEWRMTVDEFDKRLDAVKELMPAFDKSNMESKKLILDELVRQQLLVEYAEQEGINKDPEIVAAVEEFRRTLLVREVALKLTGNLEISDEEAMAFYEARKKEIVQPTEFRVRELVIKDKVEANEILLQILKGADFAELAKANSIGKTASKGGDLGYITEEPFYEMAEEILALQPGETSNVFPGPDGYYIIKLEDTRGGDPIPFEDVKEEIVNSQLLLKQQEIILEKIEMIQKKTPVEVKEELLN